MFSSANIKQRTNQRVQVCMKFGGRVKRKLTVHVHILRIVSIMDL